MKVFGRAGKAIDGREEMTTRKARKRRGVGGHSTVESSW